MILNLQKKFVLDSDSSESDKEEKIISNLMKEGIGKRI